jgi:hypothetical protein
VDDKDIAVADWSGARRLPNNVTFAKATAFTPEYAAPGSYPAFRCATVIEISSFGCWVFFFRVA